MADYLEGLYGEGRIRCGNLELLAEFFYGILFQYVLAKSHFPSGGTMRSAAAEQVVEAVDRFSFMD